MTYPILKSLLFTLDPETSHNISLQALRLGYRFGLSKLIAPVLSAKPKSLMGLSFKNSVGLAAGLDKNGDYIDCLGALGFGFIEIGTVTPKAQEGNPRPRLFRLPEAEAIINRMGFNNKGIDYLIENVKQASYTGILGINIGKNASTPIEQAIDDYLIGLRKAYQYASYITINISSPNTANLRQLQHGEFLESLLDALKKEQALLQQLHKKVVPLVVKVAPDLTHAEVVQLSDAFLRYKVDGIIATNTTVSRELVKDSSLSKEAGGLSGRPLATKSTEILHAFRQELKAQIPLIAAGGVMSPQIAQEKIDAGADLIQLYSGLIYKGPALIKACVQAIG
ncbi:MAG: quinone-dependent dihydroorotate dehydrogenase [Gammaproteobacteria bacterium]|nr:quinone-dependent dihydroorotate dehydrogenase [Gammaproteobacteria bacterium]